MTAESYPLTRAEVAAEYAAAWLAAATAEPDEYGPASPERAAIVAERMLAAAARGTANVHGSPVLVRIARRHGVPIRNADVRRWAEALA